MLGIAGRLGVAFVAVAILAISANVVMERGVRVVQSTRIDRGQYSPVPSAALGIARVPPSAIGTPGAESAIPEAAWRPALDAGLHRFSGAVDRFESVTEARVTSDSPDTTADLESSAKELEAAEKDLRRLLPRSSAGAEMDSALGAYRKSGAAYVEAADARRAAVREYLSHLNDLDGRISASINASWKIFGHVLAPASLLKIRAQIEDLRRRSDALAGPDGASIDLAQITAGELALRQTYDSGERGLVKTLGEDWVRRTREDFTRMVDLREAVARASAQILDDRDGLASSKSRLSASASTVRAAAEAAAAAPTPAAGSYPGAKLIMAAAAAARMSPVIAAATTTTTTMDTVPDPGRRLAVACITAAVLALLSAISVWTVRSILVPVDRILDATRKLAGGDVAVRVPRGGTKELDSLARAFNRMAAQLRTARNITLDYNRQLESQVEQRTRQLQHLAERDPLTLLANRRRLFVLLDQSIHRARELGRGVAVFFVDLDNFKNLNDGMGHGFGDRALISVAQRLEETAAEFGFAARLGGDEFTVVHEELASAQDAEEAGRRLVEAFRRPLAVEGREITVSVSIGASLYPDHEQRAEHLLSAADAALFRAKALGRNQLAMFTPELLENATRKFSTEQGVRRALERDEFELMYQPEVNLESLEVGLVEALVRWRMPDGRLASPEEFLTVTEESGLILELGDWVLRNAVRAASHWHRGAWPDVKVAVNVSARQLIDHGFVQRIRELLHEHALPPRCIELELTESVLQTGNATIQSLRELRSMGIAIALDDFGTGYSSFASLEQLPLSRIKLDRSLIARMDSNPRSAVIALALIRLCHKLGIEVTAEGIERESQFSCLATSRAMYLQGYLISRPVSESEILAVNSRMPQVMQDLMLGIHPALEDSTGMDIPGMDIPREDSPGTPQRAKIPSHG